MPAPQRLASAIGNAAMARVAESGSGPLSRGTVPADIEATLAGERGARSALEPQRRAGDRAAASVVARAPVTTGNDFRTTVPDRGEDTELGRLEGEIRSNLDEYNQIADDNTEIEERVRLLGELDHAIYRWFDNLQITDFDTEPLAPFMRDLMEELDAEHVNVVMAAVAAGTAPVYTAGLTRKARRRAERLWASVSQGRGMLQIESGGDDDFKAQTLSSIAKMLHTLTGRRLIDYLDRPATGAPPAVGQLPVNPRSGQQLTGYETFITPATEALTHAGFASATGRETDSSNKPISQVIRGSNFDSPYPKYTKLTAAPDDRDNYPVVTDARQYNQAVFDRKPGFRITKNGVTEYYKFGTGEGNALVMLYNQFSRGIGAGDVEVISPNFVLLAHEMGHAVRVRGGGYAVDEQFGWFGESKPNWSDRAEEMSNVIGIENPIREESGISTRSTYKTWKYVHGVRGMDAITTAFDPVLRRLQAAGFDDDEIWDWAKTQDATKRAFLYGNNPYTGLTPAEKQERKDLRDLVSRQLLDQASNAVTTFYDDFMTFKAATLLRPYLVQISGGDNNKATALENNLTAADKIDALAYLHPIRNNQNALAAVQTLLHFGKSSKFGTTGSKRADARLAALRALIAPGGSIAAATTQRETVSSFLPWA
jgi:hypothetical protein